jgi:malate synthase
VRPRGWHLDEKHVTVDGKRVAGGIFDFALFMFHNAKELLARGAGPYLYLPKVESHLEARLWNESLRDDAEPSRPAAGDDQGDGADRDDPGRVRDGRDPVGAARALGRPQRRRWDYIFSCIKKFKHDKGFCLADRAKVTMTAPFMRSYALLLLQTCHKRGAPAIGGMSALIPIKNDPVKNEAAMAGIIADKRRDAEDGYDGGWVAHPGLVEPAMKEFVTVLGDKPNQFEKQRPDVAVKASRPARLPPEKPITEEGLRMNINVGITTSGRLAGRQRLRADPQPDGRRGDRRDQPLAGLAVDPLVEGGPRRRPQGHRRSGAPARPRRARQDQGRRLRRQVRPRRRDLHADEHAGSVRRVPDAALYEEL